MWTVVYVARNRQHGEKVKSRLEQEGLLVQLRTVKMSPDKPNCDIEVLVPRGEVQEAQEIIANILTHQ
ncbi:MAG: glutamate decarboxylase [Firmicutes bacterium]|nr:glutamate decarboxylase [Bacillota bacterium]